jgi:predicted PurR-regulated permease PerM
MRIEWKHCVRIGITGLLLFLAIHYWTAFAGVVSVILKASIPLLLGCALAYVANILMGFYERKLWPPRRAPRLAKLRRPACLVLTYLSVAAILVLVLQLVIPQLVTAVQLLFRQISAWAKTLESMPDLNAMLPEEAIQWIQQTDWESALKKAASWLTAGVGGTVDLVVNTVSSVFSSVVNLALAFVFSIYLLLSKEKIGRQMKRLFQVYLKPKHRDGLYYVLRTLDDAFHSYIVGQCSEAVILGMLCIIGMLMFRFPYAVTIGALVGVTALIPVAGAYIGAVVGGLLILTISPMKALLFIVFIVVLQQLEGNLIYPKVVGTSIGLPGIWVLAAITVGGGMMGILGIFISVPIAAALYRMLRTDVAARAKSQLKDTKKALSEEGT